jgi:hypothetical protein
MNSDSSDSSDSSEPRTDVSGLWIDPVTSVVGGFKKSAPKTFAGTVRMLTSNVLEKVNREYSLQPPLVAADMIVDTLTSNFTCSTQAFFSSN